MGWPRFTSWLARSETKQGFDLARIQHEKLSSDRAARRRASRARGLRRLAAAQRWQKGS
jgi:hypothetical protein